MSPTLAVAEHRTLLRDALSAALAADTLPASMAYAPDTHRAALFTDCTVVRGAPGQGKTLWAQALADPQLRADAAQKYRLPRLERTETVTGFGARPDPFQPSSGELRALTGRGTDPTALWSAVGLTALGVPDLAALATWSERVDWLVRNPEAVERSLTEAESGARTADAFRLVVFDALDQLHTDRALAQHLASGMLNFALTLARRTTRLRAKVFIRPDMLDGALAGFPRADLSFLASHTTDLSWARVDHFGLLFHLLGNRDSAEAASFRAAWPAWQPTGSGRLLAPDGLDRDSAVQERAFTMLTGPSMGTHGRHPYAFLPVYLQDALGAVTPRSFLATLAIALEHTERAHPDHDYPLHHDSLRRSVGCGARAEELHRALPWVRLALEPLAGQYVPIREDDIFDLWNQADLADRLQEPAQRAAAGPGLIRTGPLPPASYPLLVEELIGAGVLSRRTGGQLDMPEVYRTAYGLGRCGGVRRSTRSA
ncbi:hypothetical protein [Streptomyces clavuligerus]|uniref:hypothetical protein n=1 Tax=Streptomyces clavuligerus TaxID=1901 RepID=UPI00017FF5EB|nr:hypothetical protein [Streptomyces clavuligerus]EDY49220.1 conserved hypothetical protein [Streptomyces clavuligerus]WDN56131.1 hypothetical protein LL058_30190 [Streptomyces clavuligerus]